MDIELVKENIEYEQLLGENFSDTVLRAEYIIPDTHPDVQEILMLSAKPHITNKEVVQDKVYLEGQIEYNVLYLAKEEDKSCVHSVTYNGSYANYVEISGAVQGMACEAESFLEHMECLITNERKILIEGVIKLKCEVYKNYKLEVVKDVSNSRDVQILKNPVTVDKIVGVISEDISMKAHMQIAMEKPQIGTVLKCDVNIHKKDVKLFEGKISLEALAHVAILYRGKDTRDLNCLEEDVLISKDIDYEGVNSFMDSVADFRVSNMEFNIKEDDLGENRLVDVEAGVSCSVKLMSKEKMEMIEDAYSPNVHLNMTRKSYDLNVIHGQAYSENIIKENLSVKENMPKPANILMCEGSVSVTEKKLVEDKILIDGVLSVKVLYRTNEDDKYVGCLDDEISFSNAVDLKGAKIHMGCAAKVSLENIEASIEADTILVKAITKAYGRANYITSKEFLVDVVPIEGEEIKKKASFTIYVVQKDDNLWKVAKKYSTTIDSLLKVNELESAELIKPGQKLIIPGRAVI